MVKKIGFMVFAALMVAVLFGVGARATAASSVNGPLLPPCPTPTPGPSPTRYPTRTPWATPTRYATATVQPTQVPPTATATPLPPTATPTPPSGGCTRTIGYWKNHSELIPALLPVSLGNAGGAKSVTIASAEQAVTYLNMADDPSNGIAKLYAQELGAKLNIGNGADPSAVAGTLAAADTFLSTHDLKDWESLTPDEQQLVLGWMITLDQYNNGIIGPGHCPDLDPLEVGPSDR